MDGQYLRTENVLSFLEEPFVLKELDKKTTNYVLLQTIMCN